MASGSRDDGMTFAAVAPGSPISDAETSEEEETEDRPRPARAVRRCEVGARGFGRRMAVQGALLCLAAAVLGCSLGLAGSWGKRSVVKQDATEQPHVEVLLELGGGAQPPPFQAAAAQPMQQAGASPLQQAATAVQPLQDAASSLQRLVSPPSLPSLPALPSLPGAPQMPPQQPPSNPAAPAAGAPQMPPQQPQRYPAAPVAGPPAPVAAAGAVVSTLARAGDSLRQFPEMLVESTANTLARLGLPVATFTYTSTTFTTTPAPCGFVEDNVNYPGNDIRSVPDVDLPDICCGLCAQDPQCFGWSIQKSARLCHLKKTFPRESVTRVPDQDFVSGMPLQVQRQLPVHDAPPGQSLYCFALVLPGTYEVSLINTMYEMRVSIFQCDESDVYSNQVFEVAPGVTTVLVQSSLQCEKGGEFGTALNLDIFIAVWQMVVQTARYQKYQWTVKIDPDTVFLPARLRAIIAGYGETAAGTYINNCPRGMHGPIEVLSRNAVNTWWSGKDTCKARFEAVCQGDCKWGEDMFMDQCLSKVMGVDRKYDHRFLFEEACDAPPGWRTCQDPTLIAFHPFKTEGEYKACMGAALAVQR